MRTNPFASGTYEETWLNHFNNTQKPVGFKFIKGLRFFKEKKSFNYTNIGRNYTSGMLYSIEKNETDFKGQSFIVYDVPQYLDTEQHTHPDVKIIKLKQYKGLYVDIAKYKKIEDVLTANFKSSRSRYNFRSSIKKLKEQCDLSQKMFLGSIDKHEYDELIDHFQRILEIRFDKIGMHNTVLPMWDFYKDVLFPLINEKKVALFVLYDGAKPIAMSFSFVYDDIFVVALRTFDVSYSSRLAIGNVEIYYLIEWCINNGIKTLDFSKGETEYKERWCDVEYNYEHHVIYDSKSIKAKANALILAKKFAFKQYLRDKKVNALVTRITYKLKHLRTG